MTEIAHGDTDAGRKRDNNEDNFRLLPKNKIFIVSDGMGGHNAGEVASLKAVNVVGDYFTAKRISEMKGDRENIQDEMINALLEAHQSVVEMAHTNEEYEGMGCTLVLAFLHDHLLHTCHVGDSRAYVVNKSGITQITNDHSTVGELVRAGQMTPEEARKSPMKNQISQALGIRFPITPEYNEQPLSTGDKVLLCTDGLWDMLSDEEIHSIVSEGDSPEEICKRLIDKANDAGGEDNITVVLVQLGEKTGSEGLKDTKN